MGVLIKGMDMPNNCMNCDLSNYGEDGNLYCDLWGMVDDMPDKRDGDCPLIEVPEPEDKTLN